MAAQLTLRPLESWTMSHSARRAARGSALLAAIFAAIVLAGLGASLISVVHSANVEQNESQDSLQRFYLAEAAARFAEIDLTGDGDGNLGDANNPVVYGNGSYWTEAIPQPGNTVSVFCYGTYHGSTRAIEAVFRAGADVFDNAVFAGNSSGDPNYTMHFGGSGGQADHVHGDIYSGGDVEFVGDSGITGMPRATGTITGAPGESGVTQQNPDLAAMNYDTTADVMVASEFASHSTFASNAAGGKADQVPEDNAAHIFRKNPTDRSSETSSTAKDDYFLEDPYEPVNSDSKQDGSDPYVITLGGAAGADGNNKVYYIDGNLWIHNRITYSFQLQAAAALAITIVVRGNIYISDNLFYGDENKDALALIAMADPSVSDSGNIYFGDPAFGTLKSMSAYMYAEHDFLDNNLDATGSATVELNGIMSAGNHVSINRDFGGQHSRLTVNFDDRVARDAVSLPGLPSTASDTLSFLAWRPASVNR